MECIEFAPQELGKWLFVGPRHSKTHIWSAETFCDYLEFLSGELRLRRKQLGLSLADKALIICDSASQHSSKKFPILKQRWSEQNNCEPWMARIAEAFYLQHMIGSTRSRHSVASFGVVSLAPPRSGHRICMDDLVGLNEADREQERTLQLGRTANPS